jgi:archaemetzincin
MSIIYIQPFGEIAPGILNKVGKAIQKIYGSTYRITPQKELLFNAFFRRRRQWHSATILEKSLNINIPQDAERILGICDVDLFVENLNFVFGQADSFHGTALISIFRLRPEYYQLPPDQELFERRVIKEAIHELGHTYGLAHCKNPDCIMFFSNTLADTDRKGPGFCEKCSKFMV